MLPQDGKTKKTNNKLDILRCQCRSENKANINIQMLQSHIHSAKVLSRHAMVNSHRRME
jgi:hypothetical protein